MCLILGYSSRDAGVFFGRLPGKPTVLLALMTIILKDPGDRLTPVAGRGDPYHFLSVFIRFHPFLSITCCLIVVQARIHRKRFARGPMLQTINHGSNAPYTSSACNPSAESGLASTHCFTPNSVYVEGNSDRASESWSDMTRELNLSYGCLESQETLILSINSVGPDPRLFELALH
ncbi:hypothetical protein CRG98_018990 [Punica granatum]|uniref:Uncharacterized protein n=1 Tax=Punica granatum TaxID=22663 RepID=A0A2I0JXS1_PUNGR|nr:hypothetical protein CRG98_018990 [Punica granatum]